MILVTGATGFIGGAVAARAAADPRLRVRGSVRSGGARLADGIEPALVGDLAPDTDWASAVRGVEAIVHTAARAHVMQDGATDPLAEFRRVNVAATVNLARQAAGAGVRRFVFVSSIKVNGERTEAGRPYAAADPPAPADAYGISKHEAEQGLRQVARETAMEVVVIRPVLVYGPGVKANFRSMMRWLHAGVPLPLGAIHNRRSLVALDNLVDLILLSLHRPAARNQTLLVSDGEDLSTTDLLKRTAAALGARARLLPVPAPVVRAMARVLGGAELAQRLCGSLQVDIAPTREQLGWSPPVTVDDALKQTAADFLARAGRGAVRRP